MFILIHLFFQRRDFFARIHIEFFQRRVFFLLASFSAFKQSTAADEYFSIVFFVNVRSITNASKKKGSDWMELGLLGTNDSSSL